LDEGEQVFSHYNEEAEFALQAVRKAALLSRSIQQELAPHTISKSDRSPVTVADFASQAIVAQMLADRFPLDVLVGEEDSRILQGPEQAGTLAAITRYVRRLHPGVTGGQVSAWIDRGASEPGERFWTYDPIDGTKGFLRGGQYVSALALVEGGQVKVAAMGCPNLDVDLHPVIGGSGSAVLSVAGEGSWLFPLEGEGSRRLAVSREADPTQARLLRSFEAGHTDVDKLEALASQMGITAPAVRMDSAAKYAILASGGGELIVRLLSAKRPDYREKIWDQAAGSLVVEEAGGRVTDLRGHQLDFTRGRELTANFGVLATNGLLHSAALVAVRAVGADQRPA
jgi:3'(2'), 5'-bisphosphate nucleotidase